MLLRYCSQRMSLRRGCFFQPQERFLDIFSDPISIAEQNPQIVLRGGTAVFGGSPKPLSRFRGGPPHNHLSSPVFAAVRIPISHLPFCFSVAIPRSRQQRLPFRHGRLVAERAIPTSLCDSPRGFRINYRVVGVECSTFCHRGSAASSQSTIVAWVDVIVDGSLYYQQSVPAAAS